MTSVSVGSTKDNIIGHLVGLGENETSKAMDKSLVAKTLGKIQKKNSETYIVVTILEIRPYIIH